MRETYDGLPRRQPGAALEGYEPPAAYAGQPATLASRIAERVRLWAQAGRTTFGVSDLVALGLSDPDDPRALHEAMARVCATGPARLVSPAPGLLWKITLNFDDVPGTVTGWPMASLQDLVQVTGEPATGPGLPPLAASGAPMERVWTEPDRDYPADTDLLFTRGQFTDRIRMTRADREGILAALANPGGLDSLVTRARDLGYRDPSTLRADLANDAAALAREAYRAGYALAVQDCLETAQAPGYVAQFLEELSEGLDEDREDTPDQREAVECVLALIRGEV